MSKNKTVSWEDEESPRPEDQNKQIVCTICDDVMTDMKNLCVTKTGHIFHFLCAEMWARDSSQPCKGTPCEEHLSIDDIISLHPDDPKYDMKMFSGIAAKTASEFTPWKSSLKQKCFSCKRTGYRIQRLILNKKQAELSSNKYRDENKELKKSTNFYVKEAKTMGEKFKEANKDIHKLNKNNKALQKKIQDLQSDYKAAVAKFNEANNDIDKLKEANEVMRQEKDRLNSDVNKLEASVAEKKKRNYELKRKLKDEVATLRTEVASEKQLRTSLEQELLSLNVTLREHQILISTFKAEMNDKAQMAIERNKAREANDCVNALQEEKQTLRKQIEDLYKQNSGLNECLQKEANATREAKDNVATLQANVQSLGQQVQNLFNQNAGLIEKMRNQKEENRQTNHGVQAAYKVGDRLQMRLRDMRGKNERLIGALLAMKENSDAQEKNFSDLMIANAQLSLEFER